MTALSELIKAVSAEFPDSHPHKLARLVAERTQPEDMFEFYVAALERLVSDQIRSSRNATLNSKQSRSPKREERKSYWARFLAVRVCVGDSRYKVMADCTVEDLTACISERVDQIGALQGQIVKYEAIRDAVVAHGVATVGELPEGAVVL